MKATLVLVIAGLASAGQIPKPFLSPRQDRSVTFGEIPTSENCISPNFFCGNNRLCIHPNEGEICCPEGCAFLSFPLLPPMIFDNGSFPNHPRSLSWIGQVTDWGQQMAALP